MKLLFISWLVFLAIMFWIVVPHTSAGPSVEDDSPSCDYRAPYPSC